MRKRICDVCGKEIDARENFDENGYSQFVNIAVRDSRTYCAEYDICNTCFEKSLKFLKTNGAQQ